MDRARRQIPEWESYDDKIDKLRAQVANSHSVPVTIINHDQIIISAPSDINDETPDVTDGKHVKDEL